MPRQWTAEDLLELARSYQGVCVLAAAADLDLFGALAGGGSTVEQIGRKVRCDSRAMTVLLDALVSLGLVEKKERSYHLPDGIAPLLASYEPGSVLAMVQHQATCLRRWTRLAEVVRSGRPAERTSSIRGEEADQRAFIGAMHVVSSPVADEVIGHLKPLAYRRVLDVGGGPGTWTAALLKARPDSSAILFDLPEVVQLARTRLEALGLKERVQLVGGDFLRDALPRGADLAWVSAIIHQNSREENRRLFASVLDALEPEGHIAIRDILMDPDRTSPPAGAMFAVNMLVATPGGGTFTLEEIRADLESAGFTGVECAHRDAGMSSLVTARKAVRTRG